MQKTSLLALGIHFEAGLFLLLALGLMVPIALEGSRRARTWFALGATLGFGTYFSYQTVLAVASGRRNPSSTSTPCASSRARQRARKPSSASGWRSIGSTQLVTPTPTATTKTIIETCGRGATG